MAGPSHACAIRTDGTVWCWGSNEEGQLGQGCSELFDKPVRVPNVTGAVDGGVGNAHTCVVRKDGTVWCWGTNESGELGIGVSECDPDDGDDEDGPKCECEEKKKGSTKGDDDDEEDEEEERSGRDSDSDEDEERESEYERKFREEEEERRKELEKHPYADHKPEAKRSLVRRQVSGLKGVVSIAAGATHSCAVKKDGTVWCWGENSECVLGNPETSATCSTDPVKVEGLGKVKKVYAGLGVPGNFTCALTRDHEVYCWGDNSSGQLGDGSTESQSCPVKVANLDRPVRLGAGADHVCAVDTKGCLLCWGSNKSGQLGSGREKMRRTPGRVVR
jgi:alpha-tubulin suppressor-like RCC1 family protein